MEKETLKAKEVETVSFKCPFLIRKLGVQDRQPGELVKVNRISGQVNVDKETLTVTPVIEEVDLDAEIQTYLNMCGLEYFKILLAQGKVTPESSHDDGKHAVDMSLMPKTVHEAAKVADRDSETIAMVAKALGLGDDDKLTAEKLVSLLVKQVEANASAKPAESGEGDK